MKTGNHNEIYKQEVMKKIRCIYYILFLFAQVGFPRYSISQNTGIGTTTPAEKLHVAGNLKADTLKPNVLTLTANAATTKILTSDAAGNASWQTNTLSATGSVGFGNWGDCAANANISEYNPVFAEPNAGAFGESLSMSGNFSIVGDRYDLVGSNVNQGSASIYQFNGTTWQFMQKLTDATGSSDDQFGKSVFISGNYVIVGAYLDDVAANIDQGSCSIYQFNGTNWVLMQKITDPTGTAQAQFGWSVSLSGNYALVGACKFGLTGIGSANVFQLSGGNWIFLQKLIDPTAASGDFSANSVSVSGNKAVVGVERGKVGTNNYQGYVNLYELIGGIWLFKQKVTDPTGSGSDYFGNSVSLSGDYLIVGDEADNIGTNSSQGSASIYFYNGTTWVWIQKLADLTGEANDFFGHSVSMSGNYSLVGANRDNPSPYGSQGSATIYQRVGLGWSKLQYVTQHTESSIGLFGTATAIDAATKRFVIGFKAGNGKAIFGKIN